MRRPSAEILQQIAKGLRISAEALYVQAGILEDRRPDSGVRAAVLADPELAERQKQVLLEIYESFRRETALNGQDPGAAAADGEAAVPDPGLHAAGTSPEGVGLEGVGLEGAGLEGVGLESMGAAGAGAEGGAGVSVGPGSAGDEPDGTGQKSSGAKAPAHHPRRPARSGQGE